MKISTFVLTGVLLFPFKTVIAENPSQLLTHLELSESLDLFQYYCARCHGEKANGDGRFASLYRSKHLHLPTDFTVGYFEIRPSSYLRTLILYGGEANQRGAHMPPFQDELKNKEVDLLVRLIQQTGANRSLPATQN